MRARAEQAPHAVGGVAGARQRFAQGLRGVGGQVGQHDRPVFPTHRDGAALPSACAALARPAPGVRRAVGPRSARAAHRDAARPADPDGARVLGARGARAAARHRPPRRAGARRARPRGARHGVRHPAGAAPLPAVDGRPCAGPVRRAGRDLRRRRHADLARRRRRHGAVLPPRRTARVRQAEGADLHRAPRQATRRHAAGVARGGGRVRRGRRAQVGGRRGRRRLAGQGPRVQASGQGGGEGGCRARGGRVEPGDHRVRSGEASSAGGRRASTPAPAAERGASRAAEQD